MRPQRGRTNAAPPYAHRLAILPILLLTVIAVGGWMAQRDGGFERETARIAEALGLEPGMTVADVGAGDGLFSAFLAERVGDSGRVFATEVEVEKVGEIGETVSGYDNVTVVLGKFDDTGLPRGCCDRLLLRRVYHHFLDPPDVMVQSLYRSLKPGGVIAVIDFMPGDEIPPPAGTPDRGGHGTPTDALTEEMTRNGFELVRQVEDWPGRERDYCMLFRRPN